MHVRNAYPVTLFTGKQVPEQPGDRLVVLRWKGDSKTGRQAASARCFSVPRFQPSLVVGQEKWEAMLIAAFEDLQKEIAHKYVTSELERNGGSCNDIPSVYLSEDTVLEYFNAQESDEDGRGKISAAQIAVWYESNLKDRVIHRISEKHGFQAEGYSMTTEDLKKCQQAANTYKAVMERLASPKPSVDVATAIQLRKVVEFFPDWEKDGIAGKLVRKLDGIINPKAESVVTLESL